MKLHSMHPGDGSRSPKKRLGRGIGSGHGKTSGKGHKGQKARSGGGVRLGFEGGQMPLQRRLPKRGFKNPFKKEWAIVNVGSLETLEAAEVTPEVLKQCGLVHDVRAVKVLADGELKRRVTVRAHAFSQAAREKIEAAGGTAEVI